MAHRSIPPEHSQGHPQGGAKNVRSYKKMSPPYLKSPWQSPLKFLGIQKSPRQHSPSSRKERDKGCQMHHPPSIDGAAQSILLNRLSAESIPGHGRNSVPIISSPPTAAASGSPKSADTKATVATAEPLSPHWLLSTLPRADHPTATQAGLVSGSNQTHLLGVRSKEASVSAIRAQVPESHSLSGL